MSIKPVAPASAAKPEGVGSETRREEGSAQAVGGLVTNEPVKLSVPRSRGVEAGTTGDPDGIAQVLAAQDGEAVADAHTGMDVSRVLDLLKDD